MNGEHLDTIKLYFLLAAMAKVAGIDPEKFGYENARFIGNIEEHNVFMKKMTEGHLKYLEETNAPEAKMQRDTFEKLKKKYK
ncbi:hypothetical protein LCGC14_1666150 [marine sediment metagenome]|uniref:Uncharacterized protein n=1 Tax=marine sediment metagenome TaxID=412755 RepID=A0A0F9HTA6_9ZZZZ